jgi:hypothetical protein
MATIEDILAQYQLTDEDRKNAQKQALMMAGLSMMANARKGREMEGVAYAGMNGLQSYQQGLGDAQQGKIAQYKLRQDAQKQVDAEAESRRKSLVNSQIAETLSGGANPSVGMPSRAPTVDNAAAVPPKAQRWELYQQAAEKAALGGDMAQAKLYADMAEKHKPKYSQSPQIGMDANGKPYQFVLDDAGNEKRLSAGAKPDFAEVDLGGTKQFVNKYNLPSNGQSFDKTMTLAEADSSKRGWASHGLAVQANQRAADAAKTEKATQYGAPLQITTPDGGTALYVPQKGTNTVVPMVGPDGQPVTKSASIPQKYKDTLYNLDNLESQLKSYNDELAKFSTGTYFDPKAATALTSKYASLKMDMKNLYELGALAGPDISILAEGLTDPASIKGFVLPQSHFTEQTKIIGDRLDASRANLAKAYNQNPTPKAGPVKSQSEYDALPKGAEYTAPDGTKRRKQ